MDCCLFPKKVSLFVRKRECDKNKKQEKGFVRIQTVSDQELHTEVAGSISEDNSAVVHSLKGIYLFECPYTQTKQI